MSIARFLARLMLTCVLLCLLLVLAMQALGKAQSGGGAIIFSSHNSQPSSTIEMISFNSLPGMPTWQETIFSSGSRYFADNPDCSPYGQQIVFSSNHLGSSGGFSLPDALEGYHLYILDLEDGFIEALTNQPNSYNFEPAWSPDATTLLFTHKDDAIQRSQLYMMNILTRETSHLLENTGRYQDPDWSPDGNQIIYAASFPDQGSDYSQLYVMNLTHDVPTRLTLDDELDFNDPDWSPDGLQIALSVYTETTTGFYPSGIYIMNADGSNLRQITTMPAFSPAFSPDGQMIAFAARVNEQSDIYVMNADGSLLRQITNTPYESEGSPCWLP